MTKETTSKQLQTVKYDDAVAASKEYFKGDDLAAQVWVSKYALKDSLATSTRPLPTICTTVSHQSCSASSATTPTL